MSDSYIVLMQCFMLGFISIVTSCSFVANIASVSMLIAWSPTRLVKIRNCIFFILGTLIIFIALGLLLSFGLYEIVDLKIINSRWLAIVSGPMLVLLGMFVLGMFEFKFISFSLIDKMHEKIRNKPSYAFALGCLVTLNFCPLIAFSVFAVMVPLAIKSQQLILCPLSYALGYSFAITVISCILIFMEGWVFVNKLSQPRLSKVIGVILIAVGLWEIYRTNKALLIN